MYKITETYKFYSMFKRPEETALKVILTRHCRTKRGKTTLFNVTGFECVSELLFDNVYTR
jgi:hypothetical protein